MTNWLRGANRPRSRAGLLGCLAAVCTALVIWLSGRPLSGGISCPGAACDLLRTRQMNIILMAGALGVFLACYCLYPLGVSALDYMARHWSPWHRRVALLAVCVGLPAFVFRVGNHQFGGFDLSVLVDVGWRMFNGQQPYRDFVCTLPPAFYLGVKFAYRLFGPQWNATLYMTGAFASITFLWAYFLLNRLMQSRAAAFLLALCMECAAVLTLSFWWYNSITSVIATIFFLSCLVYFREGGSAGSRISYAAALALLLLVKPNVAGPLVAMGVALLWLATRQRLRLAAWTGLAAAAALLLLLANGVSPVGLIESYRAAAVGRGGFTSIAFDNYTAWDRARTAVFVLCLLIPVGLIVRQLREAIQQGKRRRAIAHALLLAGPLVGIFAMFTNGDLKDVEWPAIFSAGAVVVWGRTGVWKPNRLAPALPRFYAAVLCALLFSDIYIGIARKRVLGIGNGMFFAWANADRSPGKPYFRDFRGSSRLEETLDQVGQAVASGGGPVFFGPRMEFSYAVFGIPSPLHIPIWWHPGTSFAAAKEPAMLAAWQAEGFGTLIFMRNDFTYYSQRFRQIIESRYQRDDRWPALTVFHAWPEADHLSDSSDASQTRHAGR